MNGRNRLRCSPKGAAKLQYTRTSTDCERGREQGRGEVLFVISTLHATYTIFCRGGQPSLRRPLVIVPHGGWRGRGLRGPAVEPHEEEVHRADHEDSPYQREHQARENDEDVRETLVARGEGKNESGPGSLRQAKALLALERSGRWEGRELTEVDRQEGVDLLKVPRHL